MQNILNRTTSPNDDVEKGGAKRHAPFLPPQEMA